MLINSALIFLAALAQTPAAPPSDAVTMGGYLDLYYQYDVGRPTGYLPYRFFDIRHNRWDLAEADFDLTKAPNSKDPFGFTIQAIAGKDADILNAAEPGGKAYLKNLGQAYVTYQSPGKTPLTVDLGKFYTWIGNEGYDSRTQINYSRSFTNTFAEPDYHVGVRLTYPATPKVTLNAYAVNGWNETKRDDHGISGGLGVTYNPDNKTSLTVQDLFGDQGSNHLNDAGSYGGIGYPVPGIFHTHLLDVIASRQLTPTLKLIANIDYGTASMPGMSGKWDGELLYLQKTFSASDTGCLRLDRFHDTDGLRSGSPVLLHSITATYDHNLNKNILLRLELRHDIADNPLFTTHDGVSRHRTTITFAQILHF